MARYTAAPALKRKWHALAKKEQSFLERQYEGKPSFLNQKLDEYVPVKLRSALNTGFCKAFELIFNKGTGIIEKTYDREKHELTFKANEYAGSIAANRRTLGAAAKYAASNQRKNLAISGIEGIGMGILGIGLPDIPVFTGVILKSMYETALSYGYDYDTEEEQVFILKLIEAAMSHGAALYKTDRELDRYIYTGRPFLVTKKQQIVKTSASISEELICMKFLQTIPVAGVVGGAYDIISLNRILKYADLKYQKRYLFSKLTAVED